MNKKLFALAFAIGGTTFLLTAVCIILSVLPLCTLQELLAAALTPFVFLVLVILIFTALVTERAARDIINKLNDIDVENPTEKIEFEEIMPFLKKLDKQKKQMQRKLKRVESANEEFKVITENMTEGFMIIDRNKELLTCNRFAKSILGIEKNEELSLRRLKHIDGFLRVVETALSGRRAEEEISLGDSSFSLIAHPVLSDGFVKGAVVLILDITETVEREKLRSEFTSNVSHELKTPLTSVSGFAEIMKDGTTPPEMVADFSRSIYDEAQRLITLVNDIIKISELDERSAQFTEEKVDLYKLCEEVIGRLRPMAEKRNIELLIKGERAVMVGVRKILEEMLYNVCDNAIKYNKENGRVEVGVSWTDSAIELTVADTGIGIPKASQPRVFERFYRVDKSHSKAIGGTGLGLSIVKHGAMYHSAKIELESTEGEGTTIKMVFSRDI